METHYKIRLSEKRLDMTRIAIPVNWNLDASSLTNIARHTFR